MQLPRPFIYSEEFPRGAQTPEKRVLFISSLPLFVNTAAMACIDAYQRS